MSNISSNSLFHFTGKRENLIGILQNNIMPRFSQELVPLSLDVANGRFSGAIPMVCFCDISLGQIRDHLSMYGNYGIGMTKEWGIRMGLNPIIYINPDTLLSGIIGNFRNVNKYPLR
jgi:hypothetical protein